MAQAIKVNYTQLGLDNLLPQFSNATRIRGLVTSFLDEMAPTQDTAFQVRDETGLTTAVGVQLDSIGLLIGVLRGGLTDDEYREAINRQIALNHATGSPSSIIDLVRLVTGSEEVTYTEYYPAEVHISVQGGNTLPANFLDLVTPAGVGSFYSVAPEDEVVWVPSEEDALMSEGVLPEEGAVTNVVILEDIN